jgi:hypothetical protein
VSKPDSIINIASLAYVKTKVILKLQNSLSPNVVVPGSNLIPETGYPDEFFVDFPPGKFGDNTFN